MKFDISSKFTDIGFLSPDMQPIIDDIRKLHATWFVFAEDVNRTGQRILADFKPSGSVLLRDVVGIVLLIRTLSNFQGVILMAERGMAVEAGTLARCCFENALFIGVLQKEGDAFLKEMQMASQYSDKAMARWVVQIPARLNSAPVGSKRRLEEKVNEIAQQIPGFEPSKFKALASRAGLDDAYIHYSVLSRDAAHPSAHSIDRYLVQGRDKSLQSIHWGAYAHDSDEIPRTLNMACLAMLEVCEKMCEMLSNTDAIVEVRSHRSVHDKLNGGKL